MMKSIKYLGIQSLLKFGGCKWHKSDLGHPEPVDLSTILSNRRFIEWSRREGCSCFPTGS
jgi:hypothetical protein